MNQRAGGKDPPSGWTDPPRRGLGPRPVVWAAFALSFALHALLVLILSSVLQQIRPNAAAFPFPVASRAPQGIDVIRLVEVDEIAATDRPEDPEEIEDVDEPQVEVERSVIGRTPVVELPPRGRTAAERLRPNLTDPRLWARAPLDPRFTELTPEQREELVIAGRLTEWYDSVTIGSPAMSTTSPSGSSVAVCVFRGLKIRPKSSDVFVTGSYTSDPVTSSRGAKPVSLPSPPAIRTLPSSSSVAVW